MKLTTINIEQCQGIPTREIHFTMKIYHMQSTLNTENQERRSGNGTKEWQGQQ